MMACMSKDTKFHKDMESENGTIISGLWSLVEQIQWLLLKMGQMKPHQNMTYYTLPGPTFYVTPAIPTQFDTVLARESKDEEGIEHH